MNQQQTRLEQQITFILELERLKGVLRASRPLGLERPENSAEHSWHVALLAFVFAEYANEPIDVNRVIKMLLVHDIVEIDAGDTPAFLLVDPALQQAAELAAAERLFNLLPAEQAAELRQLWAEFEARQSAEARFANALDRLMPALQNYYGGGGTWTEYQASLERVLRRLGPIGDGSTELWDFMQMLLEDAISRGWIAPTVAP